MVFSHVDRVCYLGSSANRGSTLPKLFAQLVDLDLFCIFYDRVADLFRGHEHRTLQRVTWQYWTTFGTHGLAEFCMPFAQRPWRVQQEKEIVRALTDGQFA